MVARNHYQSARYLGSAHRLAELPEEDGFEVVFAGRSNSGKSSALNAIVGQKALARTSKTPGRTQLINFFQVSEGRRLVDLPGYGYARVPAATREHWRGLLEAFLTRRQSLRGLIMLMDVRHPFTELDDQMLRWSRSRSLPVHVLLTKADKLKRGKATSVLRESSRRLDSQQEHSIQLFSATTRQGLAEVRAVLDGWLQLD